MRALFLRPKRWLWLLLLAPVVALAWDYEGHRLVNQLALMTLPPDFPGFVRNPKAQERIAFLSGEPDRWRNSPDSPFKHVNSPDHFIDLEDLADYGLTASNVSHFRYEFTGQLALGRAAKPALFPPVDAAKDPARTSALVGFLPWTITEGYGKLKSAFSYLRAFEEAGTPEEIENAQQNVLYLMGVLGHFVGDAAQPLHTTKHFNGWVGPNPHGYTTNRTIHSWIDGGYFQKTGLFRPSDLRERLRPARSLEPGEPRPGVFPGVMSYILEQHRLVEPLYQFEKAGKLTGEGPSGAEGRAFLSSQLVQAGQMLGDLWYSAWKEAPSDSFLQTQLLKRKNNQSRGESTPK